MTKTPQGAAIEGTETDRSAADAVQRGSGDSPKRQGDKLGTGAAAQATVADAAGTGDSPKPHGDKLERAVEEAAKR